jgi:hypothetical protein
MVLRSENATLRNGMSELKSFMKEGLRLSDKVKKRVALTLARMEVEKAVGRMKDGDASWSEFFAGFTPHEWDRVHVVKQLVRNIKFHPMRWLEVSWRCRKDPCGALGRKSFSSRLGSV